jgi:hypothetical protein
VRTHLRTSVCVAALIASVAAVNAQENDRFAPVALKLQIVISRWQGEKKISNMPYAVSVNAPPPSQAADPRIQGHANLRMASKIPVMMISAAPPAAGADGKPIPQVGPIQYQDVGTNIDCSAKAYEGGRFGVDVTIEDSSMAPEPEKKTDRPAFRSFKATDSMMLRDGQSAQFIAATDKLTGEVTKVDVTLTVVK